MGALVKTQVVNGLNKLFNFRRQTIDVSDQAIFTLKDSGLHDEEGNKTNLRHPLTASQRQSGCFLSFMMMAHPDQADLNFNHSRITCRTCSKLTFDANGIDSIFDTQMLKASQVLLVHLADLDNGIKTDIFTLKKDRDEIFS